MDRLKTKGCLRALAFSFMLAPLLSITHVKAQIQNNNNFLQGSIYERVGLAENIDPYLLYSVSLVESAKAFGDAKGYVSPHPYAIRTPKGAIYPKSYEEAVTVLNKQLKRYKRIELDIGLMQINGQHFHKVDKTEDLLKPEVNIKIASDILKAALNSDTTNYVEKVGRYHSHTKWRAQAYGKRVLAVYENIKQI